ncbi:unnamed protein product, partial [Ectocarpus sp. 4 AP-2014]
MARPAPDTLAIRLPPNILQAAVRKTEARLSKPSTENGNTSRQPSRKSQARPPAHPAGTSQYLYHPTHCDCLDASRVESFRCQIPHADLLRDATAGAPSLFEFGQS